MTRRRLVADAQAGERELGAVAAGGWPDGLEDADTVPGETSGGMTPSRSAFVLHEITGGDQLGRRLWTDYRLLDGPTPYLRGDLDGDGRPDHVVVLWGKATKKPGWFPDRYTAARSWYIHPRSKKLPPGSKRGRRPKLRGEAVVVRHDVSAVLYWTGEAFAAHEFEPEPHVALESSEPRPWE